MTCHTVLAKNSALDLVGQPTNGPCTPQYRIHSDCFGQPGRPSGLIERAEPSLGQCGGLLGDLGRILFGRLSRQTCCMQIVGPILQLRWAAPEEQHPEHRHSPCKPRSNVSRCFRWSVRLAGFGSSGPTSSFFSSNRIHFNFKEGLKKLRRQSASITTVGLPQSDLRVSQENQRFVVSNRRMCLRQARIVTILCPGLHRMTPVDRFSSCFLISTRYFPTDEA